MCFFFYNLFKYFTNICLFTIRLGYITPPPPPPPKHPTTSNRAPDLSGALTSNATLPKYIYSKWVTVGDFMSHYVDLSPIPTYIDSL